MKVRKRKVFTVSELRIVARDFELLRDSLYFQGLLNPKDYKVFNQVLDSIKAARLELAMKEEQNQGRLL